ncbi:1,4-alpha-glucan (glycogen) branching enzyme, GH-13-type [Rhodovulum sp. PH10]|uniref:1,4-alpha-glucan branching protein GlgB n=1 Tax=Rhodovulum sp. PH10 TaxID=1187851 RepID=UPI00027C1FFE|nr:1,4-alpha-glucan branching protein GlgB [Rhodovulum sp. PH10]EJW12416.1 1,4-alpha-glucan (glycogen) branching enzyme, GH-13-type [Rhodovulum sp. PH10]
MTEVSPEGLAVIGGYHADPFRYLGPHVEQGTNLVRVFLPGAREVAVRFRDQQVASLARIHDAGLFAGPVPVGGNDYRLAARWDKGEVVELDDPYRFAPVFSDVDLYLMGEGTHLNIYDKLGAHPIEHEGVRGVAFGVFAPNARRVSVVGDFNFWDGRRHAMRVRGNGFWEIFIPGVEAGQKYKYEILGPHHGAPPFLKADPYAYAAEVRPLTASVVVDPATLPQIAPAPSGINRHDGPISIYEVHLGSWRRNPYMNNSWLTYKELAEQLPPYVAEMGFTHIELLPIAEHPFDASWGYQPTGLYAPTSRFGSPHEFAMFVDSCHKHGIGVILDWVPGHFPDDPHGLAQFDGTALYEHANAMQGRHLDWNTLIYNYGRREVANFLVANALFWLERYKIDGLRVDAVASMLYLDYSRPPGGWIPNRFGGRENLEAIDFLRRFNTEVFGRFPEATTMAEESTAWPLVSRPVDVGGLGFGFKWNMGWMHDTLRYIAKDPIYRKHHHGDITFGMLYAFYENFVLPLSHDEVVHGKGSIFGRMPGDRWQRFANLRAYYTFMFGHPGKKLLFMGNEFGQEREWTHDHSLDWHLLEQKEHAGVKDLIRDLNRLYRSLPALHQLDAEGGGFEWLVVDDAENSVYAWLRRGRDPGAVCLVAVNFTPAPRHDYRLRVPFAGAWREVFNSDSEIYGGSNMGNGGRIEAEDTGSGGVVSLTLPPLAGIVLVPEQ